MKDKVDPEKLARLNSLKPKLYTSNEFDVEYQDTHAELDQEDIEFLRDEFGLKTDTHRTCINCQARQLIKYQDTLEPGKKHFRVPCELIQHRLPPGSRKLLEKIMQEEGIDRDRAMLVLRSMQDPVAWCELMFGFDDSTAGDPDREWYLRPYQKEILRCTSRRKVIRMGRRAGKTFSAALLLLWHVFHTKVYRGKKDGVDQYDGPSIMIVTPYQAQVSNIFTEMEGLLQRSPDLENQVIKGAGGSLYVKTPFLKMRFGNKAVISGFVSGVGVKVDGSAGGTMRGQNADIIYMDEMDMIPDGVMSDVILPILATRRGTQVIGTSTPIGKRGVFFKWAQEDPTFKEEHLPTTVLPQWDEVKDLLLSGTTKEGMMAEYMAVFVEGGMGVFKPSLVYAARADYSYRDTFKNSFLKDVLGIPRPDRMTIVIGIDWNKNAGTEFCVIGYDADTHKWVVLETVNIGASEFSSVKWKEEVIRLNYKWKPQYIYADEGYGHTIIEDLKLLAHRMSVSPKKDLMQVETGKLMHRLKSFNFSQKVVLKSPIDGTDISKAGKEFLVENAVRVFEDKRIIFSVEDETMLNELLAYSVLRRTPTTNKAVYGSNAASVGDHRLDALMLALGGLYLENSEYSPNSMAMSTPGLLTKEQLERHGAGDEFSDVVERLSKTPFASPINLVFQKIERQGGAGSPKDAPHTGHRNGSITRRRGAGSVAETPYDYYKKTLPRQGGYSTDHEHLNQPAQAPSVVERRSRKARRGPRTIKKR